MERLVQFLYLLLDREFPVGILTKILEELDAEVVGARTAQIMSTLLPDAEVVYVDELGITAKSKTVYNNKHLENIARDFARSIIEG